MKCIIVVNTVYLYYTIISNVVKFEVKIVFIIRVFFIVFFYSVEVDFYNREFFMFFLNVKCIYIFTLKFFDLSVFKSSFNSMFNMSKGIIAKVFSRLKKNNIYFIITIFRFIFTTLMFF